MEAAAAAAAAGGPLPGDVRLCGYLRKPKSQHRRYFVLRRASARGPARLECYESEKKFRAGGPGGRPKRAFPLAGALGISRRADARHPHLLVLCGPEGAFAVAAEDPEQQQRWFAALLELHGQGRASPDGDGDSPGPPFKEVWQVSLRPRGLGHTRNLVGAYLLCLTDKTISFLKLHTAVAAVALQLLSVRRCGHSENYFFVEVGRSAATGQGELWMQVDDPVVAQHMHETILEAMKALSEEFRGRSKSQPLAPVPISVPPRPQRLGTPPPGQAAVPRRPLRLAGIPALGGSPAPPRQAEPGSLSDCSTVSSDEGGSSPGGSRPPPTPDRLSYLVAEGELGYISMGQPALPEGWGLEPNQRASRPPPALESDSLSRGKLPFGPVAASASYPEGLNRSANPGYMAMLPGVAQSAEDQAYIPTTPGSASPPQEGGGYMLMLPPAGSCTSDGPGRRALGGRACESSASDYVNMSPLSCSVSGTPPECRPLLAPPGAAPFCSLPRSYRHGGRPLSFPFNPGRLSSSSSTSSDSLEEPAGTSCLACPPPRLFVGGRGQPAAPHSSGEYISIECSLGAPSCVHSELQVVPAEASEGAVSAVDGATAPVTRPVRADGQGRPHHGSEAFPGAERNGVQPCEAKSEPGLNYIDLDLVKGAGAEVAPALRAAAVPSPGGAPNTYASIDFHRLWELHGCKPSPEQAEL